jgi:hypothetical protein
MQVKATSNKKYFLTEHLEMYFNCYPKVLGQNVVTTRYLVAAAFE